MRFFPDRRSFLEVLASLLGWPALVAAQGPGQGGRPYPFPADLAAFRLLSLVLGRVTDRSVTVSALARERLEGTFSLGTEPGKYTQKTQLLTFPAGEPVEHVFDDLKPDTPYFYRLDYRKPGVEAFTARPECRFHTQRAPGSTFTFAVQGDSHPERPQMSEPNLYARTLLQAAAARPDFYVCIGDDFSVDTIRTVNADNLAGPYLLQRPFLGLVAQSAPLFLVNGNHEQASLFNYNQTDERHDVAVGVQNARNRYYPTPAPDRFYTGNTEPLKSIGLLKNYCAWTWGDALFVILDNYWHSPSLVDTGFSGGKDGRKEPDAKDPDWWGKTLGDAQYQWFAKTLEESKARYKFVFAHHVLGSGRGGVDQADLFEWGGKNKRGEAEFSKRRPGWKLPIHPLMVKHGVTLFFQGHDHLFARQERDGIIYQEVPMPADHGYATSNEDRYRSGVKLPNSGYLRVTVAPEQVQVDYLRSFLPKDEADGRKTGDLAHSYTVKPKPG